MIKAGRIAVSAACAVGASVVGLSTTAPGASATTGRQAAAAIGHTISPASDKATLAYWTPARMRSAKDVSTLIAGGPVSTAPVGSKSPGKPGRVAGGLPVGAPAPRGTPAHSAPIPQAFSYPFPYDSFNVPNGDYQKFPWRVNGKIFFSNDGGNYVCSGTSVAGVNGTSDENEVWTAGHCVSNTDGTHKWDTSAIFIPAYNGSVSNTNPYGEFVVSNLETTTAWLNNGDFSEDEGAMLVGFSSKKPAQHRILGNLVGWAGFAWNYASDQQFVTFGYPAESPYNGKLMVEDIAASAVRDTGIGGAGSAPIGIGSPLTGGSSGGAWDFGWSDTGTGYINGHNDYKYNSEPLAMFSPYQDTLSNTIRCFGASSC